MERGGLRFQYGGEEVPYGTFYVEGDGVANASVSASATSSPIVNSTGSGVRFGDTVESFTRSPGDVGASGVSADTGGVNAGGGSAGTGGTGAPSLGAGATDQSRAIGALSADGKSAWNGNSWEPVSNVDAAANPTAGMQLNGYTEGGQAVYLNPETGTNHLASGARWDGEVLPAGGANSSLAVGDTVTLKNAPDGTSTSFEVTKIDGNKVTVKDVDGTKFETTKANIDSGAGSAAKAAQAAAKEFSEWAGKRAGELADELGEGVMRDLFAQEGFRDLPLNQLSSQMTEKLASEIEKQLTQEALSKYGKLTAEQAKEISNQAKEAAAKKVAELLAKKILSFNYIQYGLIIAEALKANEIDDATKEVTVRGAEPMQQSQGSQTSGASVAPLPSSEIKATSIASAANAMVNLLNFGKIDLSLLSTDIEKPKEEEKKEEKKTETPAVQASSSASQAGVSASEVQARAPVKDANTKEMNTKEQREIIHRRSLLLSEWAAAATQIGEGSNAISSDFYARAAAFSAAASAAQGSMGGINTITDSDRFVLFELTRGAALSAVQLGLQGAVNLNALDEVMDIPATEDIPTSRSGPGVTASSSSSQ